MLVDAQAAELYPTVDANVAFSAQRYSSNSVQAKLAGEHFRNLLVNPLVLRYHLDLWGQDNAVLEGAIGKAQAAETELADARLLLTSAVVKAYFEVAALVEKRKVTGKLLECRKQLTTLSKVRFNIGLKSAAPFYIEQAALKAVEEQQTAFHTEHELQKNLLAVLAGKGPDWGRSISIQALAEPTLILPNDLPLRLLAHRPDVQAARMGVEAEAQEVKVAKTSFYPDINLVAFAGLHSVSISDVLLQGTCLVYAVGHSIDFPIFEGGRLRAQLGYQEAAYDEAVEVYNAHVLRAVRVKQQQQLLSTVGQSCRIVEVLYRQGLKDRYEALVACTEEQTQRLKMAGLHGEFLKTAAQLYTVLGGGYYNTAAKH